MRKLTLFIVLLLSASAFADEGMWMLGNLNKQTRKAMKEVGLNLSPDKLYHPRKASLSDAVVSFGGFCSGVVVSDEGLVFTNHHCGFDAIQQHTTLQHNYLRDGFVARTRSEELSNPELFVRFLLRTEDVTGRVLAAVSDTMSEHTRATVTDSVLVAIQNEVYAKDSTLVATVDSYYAGNEFWLSVYRDFNDVRLVFAPPSSIGKFGWDTDNWVWPRHTGDFCVFRIYADEKNNPAEYSPTNRPYRPEYVAPISLDGYKEGSFCMTLGYPGTTDRYISSYGIEDRMNTMNQAMIDVRGVKQAIWKREMDSRDDIRIKYASKYDESSNYWKNSIGTNKAIHELNVLERKREMERSLMKWIQSTPSEREKLLHLFTDLELNYKERLVPGRAMAYFSEAFLYGAELPQLALEILNFDMDADEKAMTASFRSILEKYENLDVEIDKEVFTAMIGECRSQVDSLYLPEFYQQIATDYSGSDRAFVDSLYSQSKLTTPLGLRLMVNMDSTYQFMEDPLVLLTIDLIIKAFEFNYQVEKSNNQIERCEREFNAAVRRMYADRSFYPDANSTMRLSFGTVRGYRPCDGTEYDYFTTTRGIMEKVREHEGDIDFEMAPEVLSLLSSGSFGRYANNRGTDEMSVCFISDNDITGGNSGSAMFNDKGELLGLAFDGNWEAMSSDFLYEPNLQRCIGVDVRYILFLIEKLGEAPHLIKELRIAK